MEKLNLLDWALDSEPDAEGVFYCDADISFLGPLPSVPSYAKVAISPHMINLSQQKLYGTYNAGFVWVKTKEAVAAWRAACPTSRHFEQAALECFDAWENVYHFPVQHNYGWWRFFMGDKPYNLIKDEWTLADIENHVGLMVQGIPICSIHTHWTRNDYPPMPHFNAFVRSLLMSKGLTSENAAKFFKIISGSSAYKI
jgi:hypothetical protein